MAKALCLKSSGWVLLVCVEQNLICHWAGFCSHECWKLRLNIVGEWSWIWGGDACLHLAGLVFIVLPPLPLSPSVSVAPPPSYSPFLLYTCLPPTFYLFVGLVVLALCVVGFLTVLILNYVLL